MGGDEDTSEEEMTLREMLMSDAVEACIVYCRIGKKNFFVHFGYSYEEIIGIGHIIETRMTDAFNLPLDDSGDVVKEVEKEEVAGYA